MVNQNLNKNNRNNVLRASKSKYQQILDWINLEPLSLNEIRNKLNKSISLQGIKKHLDKMIDNGDAIYLGKSGNYKRTLKESYNKKWDTRIREYYIATPISKKFFDKLKTDLKEIPEAKDLIVEILRPFQGIEVMSKMQKYHLTNRKSVMLRFKNKNNLLTKEEADKKIQNSLKDVENFSKIKIKLSEPINPTIINGKEYVKVSNSFIEKERFLDFLSILNEDLDHWMRWVAWRPEKNRSELMNPLLNKLRDLFVMKVKYAESKI